MWMKTGRTGSRKSTSRTSPYGRSAHTEAGWFAGKGLKTIVYMPEKQEPELMYKLFDGVVGSLDDLIHSI